MHRFYRAAVWTALRLPRGLMDILLRGVLLRLGWWLNPWRRRSAVARYRRILAAEGRVPSDSELLKTAREAVEYHGRLLLSMLAEPEDLELARTRLDLEFWPLLEAARREGRGAVVCFSDFGLFPYTLFAMFLRGVPMRVPIFDRRSVLHLPCDWANSFVSYRGSGRECLAALSRNEVVVVTTLFNLLPKRLAVEFFGAPARVGYAPARLAAASGAPILPVFTIEEGGRLRAVSEGAVRYAGGADGLVQTTRQICRQLELQIRRRPSQWLAHLDFWDLRAMDSEYRTARRLQRLF